MKIGNFFSRLNIRTKLIVLCYSVAFFLSVIFGIFVYSTSKKYTSEKVNESNVNIVQQISKNIDNVRNNSFQISTLICVNPDFQEYMRDTRNETTFPESNIDYINAAGSEISLMIIYNSKGKPVYYRSSDMSTGIHNLSTDEEWDLYNAAVEKEGGPLWIRFSSDSTLFLSRNKQNKLVLLRAIKDIYTMDYLGLMVLCINEQTVQKECAAIYNEGESIIAFNDDDQPRLSVRKFDCVHFGHMNFTS